MDRFTVYKTDKGRYAVRPIDWAGIWDNDWNIKENGINHTAIFEEKEDAEFFARTKNLEEQGKLLILPCKPGDTVYVPHRRCVQEMVVLNAMINEFGFWFFEWKTKDGKGIYPNLRGFSSEEIGETVFLTEQEAKEALEGMKNGN